MMNHWIIAPIILPAIVGAVVVLTPQIQRILSLVATVALGLIAIALFRSASAGPPEVYFLGNWPAPFGIVLVLDKLSALMVLLTAALALAVHIYVIGSGWDTRGRHFYALFQFQLMGICGAFLTGDAFNLFVFFEVLLIASYGLMIHGGGRARLRAGVQYIAFNLVGSSLFLFALALLYAVTGTLNIADIAVKAQSLPVGDGALFRVAIVMLMLVFAIKGALVPLQFWLPETYANAPGPVAALFAVMTKIGAYAAIRFGMQVVPPSTPAIGGLISDLMLPAALVTLSLGAIGMFAARDVARLAAFATIASMGMVFIAVSVLTPASVSAALYYMVHSTFAGAALFLLVDMVSMHKAAHGARREGAMVENGLIAALFMATAVAVAGMPPLSGFIGKLLIMQATWAEKALIWPFVLIASLVVIVALTQRGVAIFWKPHGLETAARAVAEHGGASGAPRTGRQGGLSFVAVFALLGALVWMTVWAGPITAWIQGAVAELSNPSAYIDANKLSGGGLK